MYGKGRGIYSLRNLAMRGGNSFHQKSKRGKKMAYQKKQKTKEEKKKWKRKKRKEKGKKMA